MNRKNTIARLLAEIGLERFYYALIPLTLLCLSQAAMGAPPDMPSVRKADFEKISSIDEMKVAVDALVANHRGLLSWYERMAPLQDKIFKFVQREMDDIDETERWKLSDQDEDSPQDDYS